MISRRVKRLIGQGAGQAWSASSQTSGQPNLLKDHGWSGWSARSGWNRTSRFTREQTAWEDEYRVHGHHIYPDHPDHLDHVKNIKGLDRSGYQHSTSTALTTAWPTHLLEDEAEVVLRGELATIEQE